MADIVVANEAGVQVVVSQAAPVQFVLGGAYQGQPGGAGPAGPGVPNGGTTGQFLGKTGPADQQTGWLTPPTGSVVQNIVNQTAHGFSTGQIIRLNPSGYFLSLASTQEYAEVIGMVGTVIDANHFYLITEGYVTGLQGFTPGILYFLSNSYAGQLTSTEPTTTGQISKPLFLADSTTSGYFHNYRGIRVGV